MNKPLEQHSNSSDDSRTVPQGDLSHLSDQDRALVLGVRSAAYTNTRATRYAGAATSRATVAQKMNRG